MLNYKEIIEELDSEKLKNLLNKLNIPFEETDNYLLMPTVCHHSNIEEASWKLYFYKNTHLFYCYTECGRMSIFKFLEHYYEARDLDYEWYNDVYLVAKDCSNLKDNFEYIEKYQGIKDKYRKRELIDLPEYNKSVLETFVKRYPIEWIRDGIDRKAMDKFNIMYSISQNKIIIPHYDTKGRLVGVRGRALNQSEIELFAKYAPVKVEQIIYKHPLSMNVYGLYENKENILKTGIVFIAESEKSCLQAESFSRLNCTVATCGSSLNIFHIKKIIQECHPQEIVLCYDQEEIKGQELYFYKLWNMCNKYKNYCNISFIYDREGLLNLKDSPFDRGEETFEKLLSKRVKVK